MWRESRDRTQFLVQVKVERTNFAMSNDLCNPSSTAPVQNDDHDESSSPVVVDSNDAISLYNAEVVADTVLEQFFDELKTHDDGTKSAKCLVCRTVVKQSTSSTYNYGRHVERKHKTQMDQWKVTLHNKEKVKDKKQPTIQQSFGQRSKLFLNDISQQCVPILF